ncbi:ATP-binding protein [Almyronema epifaneia]|uniref:histidine kinase n=1 Tax=Almyronema epifaneia S1 TaxID=2991925 RepID=A0ABW6IH16_9CYAN
MVTLTIAQFLSQVPSCKQSSTIALAWQCCCRSQQDYLVLVNLDYHPVGLLKTAQIAVYLSQTGGLPAADSLVEHFAAEIEPLRVISADTLLSVFWQQLAAQPAHWAIVDAQSRYLGLLDSAKLLQFVAAHPAIMASLAQPAVSWSGGSVLLGKNQLLQRLSAETSLSTLCQQILIETFEQLPLPLQLQSGSGQVLGQTPTWQDRFAELAEVAQVPATPTQSFQTIARTIDPVGGAGPATASQPRLKAITATLTTAAAPEMTNSERSQQWQVWRVPIVINLAELTHQARFVSDWVLNSEAVGIEQLCAMPDLSLATPPLQFWLLIVQPVLGEWQQMQALSDRNADLEHTNLLKAELLGCLSHELKTPLTSLLGLSKLLQDHRLGSLNERQNRYAALIYQNARSLKATVNEILDLTRIESGQMTITSEPVNLAELCRQALLQAEDYNRARGEGEARTHPLTLNQFHLKIEPGLEQLVVDELRLQQILIHLLSNALKCTPETGEIGLTVQRWGNWILISVWDTGVGIPIGQQRFIFHRLQRIENPLTQRFTGPGLGLVLVRQLARLQGGEISFVSQPAQGSQFTLMLPTTATLPEQSVPAEALLPTAEQMLVVILETDPVQLAALSQSLKSMGCWPAIARSQQELIEKVRQLRPRAALLNLATADLNVEWLMKQLRTEAEKEPLALIAIATESAPVSPDLVDHVLNLPIDAATFEPLFAQFQPKKPTLAKSTLLLLKQTDMLGGAASPVDQILQQYQCRVLEVDDIDQARLLAQIWRPQVILLDPEIADPGIYLQRLSQQPSLAHLPIVTLTSEATQLANQLPPLKVFPCLAALSDPTSGTLTGSPLLEAIQVAIQTSQPL